MARQRFNRPRPKLQALAVTAAYTRAREGGFNATIVGGIGVHAQGDTLDEARYNLYIATLDMLELAPHQLPASPARRRPRGSLCETFVFGVA